MEIKLCVGILPYFYLMFGWINKLQTNEDWVTLLILLAFYLIVFLYKRYPSQLTFFLKSWKINNFSIIYKKEKFFKPFTLFNLILLVIILVSYFLLSYFFYDIILSGSFGKVPFLFFIFFISFFISFRYFFLKIIFWYSDLEKIFSQTIYKSFSFHGSISIFILTSFIIFYYGFQKSQAIILFLSIITSLLIIISHFLLYWKIAFRKPEYSFYIFLYICGLKIAPWLWLYWIFY